MTTTTNNTTAIKVSWKGGLNGQGQITSAFLETGISLPKEFGGAGNASTPEELLLSALGSCLLATLGIVLDKNDVKYESLTLSGELITQVSPPQITEVILRPKVVTRTEAKVIQEHLARAESFCPVGRAVQGNVKKNINLEVLHP